MNQLMIFFRMCRIHQWCKNALLFVALLASQEYSDLTNWYTVFLAFIAFSLCASSGYIQNDLLDRRADRAHSKKRLRPIASGEVSAKVAIIIAIALLVIAMWMAHGVSRSYLLLLVVYFQLSSVYSLFFKRVVIGDVFFLAGLYVIRILGGGYAVGVSVSVWLLLVSGFFFASLAFLKRYVECRSEENLSLGRVAYKNKDAANLMKLGVVCGFTSLVVFAGYRFSEQARENYSYPCYLWVVLLLVAMWLRRVWMLATKDKIHHDPVVFALRDPFSYLMGLLAVLILLVAK